MILNMWLRVAVAFMIAACLLAQTQMNVEQMADFIRSELALRQHTDRQIAAEVRKLQLTEKLLDKTILDLEAQGAGPKTVEALRVRRPRTTPPIHRRPPPASPYPPDRPPQNWPYKRPRYRRPIPCAKSRFWIR
jgi:hypothetical protein